MAFVWKRTCFLALILFHVSYLGNSFTAEIPLYTESVHADLGQETKVDQVESSTTDKNRDLREDGFPARGEKMQVSRPIMAIDYFEDKSLVCKGCEYIAMSAEEWLQDAVKKSKSFNSEMRKQHLSANIWKHSCQAIERKKMAAIVDKKTQNLISLVNFDVLMNMKIKENEKVDMEVELPFLTVLGELCNFVAYNEEVLDVLDSKYLSALSPEVLFLKHALCIDMLRFCSLDEEHEDEMAKRRQLRKQLEEEAVKLANAGQTPRSVGGG